MSTIESKPPDAGPPKKSSGLAALEQELALRETAPGPSLKARSLTAVAPVAATNTAVKPPTTTLQGTPLSSLGPLRRGDEGSRPGSLRPRTPQEEELALRETAPGHPAPAVTKDLGDTAVEPEANTLPESEAPPSPALPRHIEDGLRQADQSPRRTIEGELPRGASLGRYLVLGVLGAGGMGVVYSAYDPELDRKVAIKLLRTDIAGEDAGQARRRLLREAQAMARLQHPQVIAVYDVGTIKSQVFIAMELIEGSTLSGWLKAKPRRRDEILEVFTLAGRGLAAAHAAGLVHRDFKPDNVLVGKDGQVRVTDFGLARKVSGGDDLANTSHVSDPTLNEPGALVGTPRYMAPEQYSGDPVDQRTDQFSFCVALYEALYGVAPFAGDTIGSRGFNVVRGRVLSAPADARVPAWLRQVLLRGLSVRPESRYTDMEGLLVALNRDRRGVPKLWLATIVVVVAALGVNLVYHLRKEDREALCRGSEAKLKGIWDPARKQELKTRLLGTGKPYAADSWQRIEQVLDEYAQSWVSMRTAACMATMRGQQPAAVLELRDRCLDDGLHEVKAFTNVLATGAADMVLESSNSAVHELPSVARCADVEALRAPPPLPENPKERAEVQRLTEKIHAVRAEQRFGSYGLAINEARQLVEQASRVKYLPVKAEALSLLGQVEQPVDARRAEKTLVQAAAAAFESHNQKLVAETWIRLTALTGNILREPEKAASWEMLADAALEALSPSDAEPLQAQLQLARCRVEIAKRSYDKAIKFCQQALTLGSKVYGDSRPEVADVLHVLATAYRGKADYAHAMQNYKEALEVEQKGLGSVHPSIASNLRGIGLTLILQNRGSDAQPYLERALGIMQQSLGQDHIRTSDFYLLVGKNLLALNRVADAELPLRRCFSIREKATDAETVRAEARYFLGQALARLGSYGEALNLNVVGLELIERAAKRSEARVAYNLHAIGVILIALGRSDEAVPYLERALSIRRNLREEELRANLQRLAETQFALAQALWGPMHGGSRRKASEQAHARASELAQAAQANYTEWGNKPENQLEAVNKWLAAPKNKPPVLAALGFGEGLPPSSLTAKAKGGKPDPATSPPLPAPEVLAPPPAAPAASEGAAPAAQPQSAADD